MDWNHVDYLWINSMFLSAVCTLILTMAVTTASPAVVSCHRGCVLPPAVVHMTSHTLMLIHTFSLDWRVSA